MHQQLKVTYRSEAAERIVRHSIAAVLTNQERYMREKKDLSEKEQGTYANGDKVHIAASRKLLRKTGRGVLQII